MHKVIFDTDPGVDDAMALIFQASHPDIDLIGVTSVFGNSTIDTTTRNAVYLVEEFAGANVIVARGAGQPLRRSAPKPISHIHGANGLGDIPLPDFEDATDSRLDGRPAHQFIIDAVRQYPHEINLLAVGPLTNLALALQLAPDIQGLVKRVIVMGGAFGTNGVLGNVSPCAEANIAADPDAADIVFRASWDLTALGLDVTQKTIMSTEYLSRLRASAGKRGQFVWDVTRVYEQFHRDSAGVVGIYVHDSSTVAYLLAPHLYGVRNGPVRVSTDGITAGFTIQKPDYMSVPAPMWDAFKSRHVCVDVDVDRVLQLFFDTLTK